MEIEDLICRLKQTGEKEDYETSIKLEKILEENEQLKQGIIPSYEQTISELEKELFDSIPKSKIKEKVEELNEIEKEMHENKNHSNDINEIYKYAVEEDKAKYGAIFLQDLLKGEDE